MPPETTSTVERQRNPRGEGGRLRTDLLDAAAELMARHGSLDKVSVRAVAGEAGVSPTAVYRHFDNHTELLWASVSHCFDEFTAAMAAGAEGLDDPYDRLPAMGEAYIRFAMDNPGKYRVMFSNRVELPARENPAGMRAFDQLVAAVAEILTARDDDRDPHFVSVQVWTWIHGIVDLVGNHEEIEEMWPDTDLLLIELNERLDLGRP